MNIIKYLLAIATYVALAQSENVGWKSYFEENPIEFHDIPLTWEGGDQTNIPSWLSGVYVRNGPAQVDIILCIFFYFEITTNFIFEAYIWFRT